MIKILIADNDYIFLENLFNELNEEFSDIIKVVKICSNGKKVVECINRYDFDVLLLELDIQQFSGIDILKYMSENNIRKKVIVMSANKKLIMKMIKEKIMITQILIKPFNSVDLMKIILNIFEEKIEEDKNTKISQILKIFNFNKTNKGYKYIEDCLKYCIEKNYKYIPQAKKIYKNISLINGNVSQNNIEWNIAKCIQIMNKSTPKEIIGDYFPYTSSPSPKIFMNEILNIYYKNNADYKQ